MTVQWIEFDKPWHREFFGAGEEGFYWTGKVLKHYSPSNPLWENWMPKDIQLFVEGPSGNFYIAKFCMGNMKATRIN